MPSDLSRLADDLRDAADDCDNKVVKAVRHSGNMTKRMWSLNAKATARRHGKHYPRAVTMDMMSTGDWTTAEVGPDKGLTQGALGNLLEFGSRNNPAHSDGERALNFQEPRFVAAMERAAEVDL